MPGILGIGTDLVLIGRIERLWNRFGDAFARRNLTPKEQALLQVHPKPLSFLATRFAAKEAVAKAFGTGFRSEGVRLTEISILNDPLGKPFLEFSGRTAEQMKQASVSNHHVSLSDEGDYALAFVILLKE